MYLVFKNAELSAAVPITHISYNFFDFKIDTGERKKSVAMDRMRICNIYNWRFGTFSLFQLMLSPTVRCNDSIYIYPLDVSGGVVLWCLLSPCTTNRSIGGKFHFLSVAKGDH